MLFNHTNFIYASNKMKNVFIVLFVVFNLFLWLCINISFSYFFQITWGIFLILNDKWATTWQKQQNDYAPSEHSVQPRHPPSLIRVFAFAVRSMGSEGPKVSSCGKRRLWSDWANAQVDLSFRCAHSFCWFCHVAAQILMKTGISGLNCWSFRWPRELVSYLIEILTVSLLIVSSQ